MRNRMKTDFSRLRTFSDVPTLHNAVDTLLQRTRQSTLRVRADLIWLCFLRVFFLRGPPSLFFSCFARRMDTRPYESFDHIVRETTSIFSLR